MCLCVCASITTFPKKTMFEKQWVNDEVKKLCEEKSNYHLQIKTLKANGHAIPLDLTHRYKQGKSKTKIACRKTINTWWENKAEETEKITEKSIKKGRGGSISKFLKLIKTSKIKTSTNLKGEDGITIITSSDNKINRWKEYFAKSAKNDTVVDDKAYNELIPPTISLAPEVVKDLSRPISQTKLLRVLKPTKMETVPGIDEISSNMLKAGAEVAAEWLKVIMDKIWETEFIPKDWTNHIIIPIHKHGSRSRCENYSGISLLCVGNKIFSRAVLNRMQDVAESQLGEHQAGFRPNRGCWDQIFATKILMQRAKEFNKAIYICFVNLHKAYDTVNRNALWKVLSKSFSIPEKLIRILKTLHCGTTGLKHADGQFSEKFPIEVGVKQGDVLASMLFNLFLDAVIRVALKQHPDKGVQVEYTYNAPLMHNSRYKFDRSTLFQNLSYADDIMLTSSNIEGFECLVTSLNNTCAKL